MKSIVASLVLILLFGSPVSSAPVRMVSILDLTAEADLVVKGYVSHIDSYPSTEALWSFQPPPLAVRKAVIQICYAIKGNIDQPTIDVLFAEGNVDLSFVPLVPHGTYLLFLMPVRAGTMKLADPQNGAMPVAPGPRMGQSTNFVEVFRQEFVRGLQSSQPSVLEAALVHLQEIGDYAVLDCIKPFLQSAEEDLKYLAMSTAVACGGWQYGTNLVSFLEEHSTASGAFILPQGSKLTTFRMLNALERTSDTNAVELFGALVRKAKNPAVRKALLRSPCLHKNTMAVPFLVEFLKDPNDDVAYEAYRSLVLLREEPLSSKEHFLLNRHRIKIPAGKKTD